MLEKKLKEVGRKSHTRYLSILAVLFLVAAGLAVFVFARQLAGPNTTEPVATPEEPMLQDDQVVVETNSGEDAKYRDEFRTILDQYQDNLEPKINSSSFEFWNSAQQTAFNEEKAQAISKFFAGDYSGAITDLKALTASASKAIDAWDAEKLAIKNKVEEALAADDYQTAKLYSDQLMRLTPDAEEALRLAEQVAALPKLLTLIRTADIAKTEGNLDKELTALNQALELSSSREELISRRDNVEERILQRDFSKAMSDGLAALADLDLDRARASLATAKALDPERPELKVLSKNIRLTAEEIEVERLRSGAARASKRDDWAKAAGLFDKAIRIRPNDKALINGKRRADAIVAANAALDGYLARPDRLSASNIRANAETLIAGARGYNADSPSLRKKITELDRLIEGFAKEVPVTIVSDNQTSIRVLGVGYVGKVSEKIIQLTPGQYRIEGIRNGFKAKLITVTIKPNMESSVVRVFCDEPI